jgi:calcium-dependent protein kinase
LKSEDEIREVMFQLMDALSYIHQKHIVHRDIKPENILYDPETKVVKLVDFGIAKRFRRKEKFVEMWTSTGTLFYRAPEMFSGGYREGVDVWAAGILLYKLVAGKTPFESEYQKETISNIKEGNLVFSLEFKKCSSELRVLVSRMLQKDVKERLTAR